MAIWPLFVNREFHADGKQAFLLQAKTPKRLLTLPKMGEIICSSRNMQTNKIAFRRIARWFLVLVVGVYAAESILSTHASPPQYANCEKDTKDLKGGIKTFGGKKFNIVLCGNGGDENLMNDKVRMQILSERGVLLAQRTFHVDWESNRLRELAYGEDHLIYFDASQNNNYKHKVNMPPTWFDWVRARLP